MISGIASSKGTSIPWRKVLSIVFRVALLSIAILVLRRELDGVGAGDLLASLRSYGFRHVAFGVAFTAASFLALGLFELLALKYVGRRAERIIPRRTAFATAFVAHAYSQSVGLAILTGTAVRIRSYSRYGLDALDVARLSVFVTATATLGLLTTGGVAFITTPGQVRLIGGLYSIAPLGFLLLVPIAGYVAWSAFGRSEFHGRGRWRIRRPSMRLALEQISISSLDWALAGTVLFFLLPPSLHISYSGLLAVYLVAQTAAVLSHVPGGVGVFEAVVLALLTMDRGALVGSSGIAASIVASLFVYRVVYYLLPLCAAIALSAIAEVIRSRAAKLSQDAGRERGPLTGLAAPDAI